MVWEGNIRLWYRREKILSVIEDRKVPGGKDSVSNIKGTRFVHGIGGKGFCQ